MTQPGARDVVAASQNSSREGPGRSYIVGIGIDAYPAWTPLQRAVSDARGACNAFQQFGFKEFRPALLDGAATAAALQQLVNDELRTLGTEDNLVLFFAGHGCTVATTYADGTSAKLGYLVPVDAGPHGSNSGCLVSIDGWMHSIAHLPAKHILVIIDACHSGIALNPVIRWRGDGARTGEPFARLRERRSRRIITSARDDEFAQDSGPLSGHSLFTGCLIEALSGGIRARTGHLNTTGSELALHVSRRVASYPGGKQTPDFGAFELDDRGELIFELPDVAPDSEPLGGRHLGARGIKARKYSGPPALAGAAHARDANPSSSITPGTQGRRPHLGAASILSKRARRAAPQEPHSEPVLRPSSNTHSTPRPVSAGTVATPHGTPASPIDAAPGVETAVRNDQRAKDRASNRLGPASVAFVSALDHHQLARQRGGRVVSFVSADPMTGTMGWANWAASRGHLTIATEATGLSTVTANLLDQMPWLRLLRSARTKLAAANALDPDAFDAALGCGAIDDARAWLAEAAGHDPCAQIASWLLALVREPWGSVPDLSTAPIEGGDLLAGVCELGAPVAVLLHHAEPTVGWLERAIQTAAALVDLLAGRPVAVVAPPELTAALGRSCRDSAAFTLARRGDVPLAAGALRVVDPARSRAGQALHAALARDPRTAGMFELSATVPTHDREVQVDLISRDALLAIEIDDWYLLRDPRAYATDRIKDVSLARSQFYVMRFLVEDVERRIEETIEEVALGIAGRRASGSFVEKLR